MKKIIFILILALFTGVAASAQNKGMSPEKAERVFNAKAKMMQNRLQLTADQIVKFAPVYKSYQDAVRALKRPEHMKGGAEITSTQAKENVISQLDYKISILEVQKSFIPRFAEVLTPQQLTKLLRVENDVQMSIMKERMKRGKKDCKKMQGCTETRRLNELPDMKIEKSNS